MCKNGKPVIQVILGHMTEQCPVWLMRQAGRYLPEYHEVKNRAGGFMELCLNPKLASEVTLQPVNRFGVDAAIILSDILMVPHALGMQVRFDEKTGPLLDTANNEKDLERLKVDIEKVSPVFEAIELVKAKLSSRTAMIGFCGGLWTVACYMIEGKGKGDFKKILSAIEYQPEFMDGLIKILYEASFEYLCKQIEAGAEVIQLFDSWAGLLEADRFRKWIIEPTKMLVHALEAKYPEVPVIGFPRGASPADYKAYVMETGVDVLGVDQKIPLNFIRDELQVEKPVQGNLDPVILLRGGDELSKAVTNIMETLSTNHIFNLGHGILPDTPPENVEFLVKQVKEFVTES